jgi:hypothetical protein
MGTKPSAAFTALENGNQLTQLLGMRLPIILVRV